jgi:hypothetical protein
MHAGLKAIAKHRHDAMHPGNAAAGDTSEQEQ